MDKKLKELFERVEKLEEFFGVKRETKCDTNTETQENNIV